MALPTPPPTAPSARQARDHISVYADRALKGETTEVFSRKVPIATIAPLPVGRDLSELPTIATSALKSGRRTFMSLWSHGPEFVLTRSKRPVALLSVSVQAARRAASGLRDEAAESEMPPWAKALEAELDEKLDAMLAQVLATIEKRLPGNRPSSEQAEPAKPERKKNHRR